MSGRVPPQSIEAEKSIIGGLLTDPQCWDVIADRLSPEDFYKPAHQVIYNAIRQLHQKNLPVDLITVDNLLKAEDQLAAAGGVAYITEILSETVSNVNIEAHAKIVREKALLRRTIQMSAEIIDEAYGEQFSSVDEFIDKAEGKFFQLGETKQSQGLTGPLELVKTTMLKIDELYKKRADITGLASGFAFLDKMTSGFQPGELIILAARPSMGKTALSLNIAQHVALREKKTVAYFSCEMSKESVMMRLLSAEAGVNLRQVITGKLDSAWPKLIEAAGTMSDARIYIDDSSPLSPFEIRSKCRRLKARYGLDLIMVDYLQMMKLKEQKVESREREVAEISRTLKGLAKELQIPVVALAQLNRTVEGRTEKRPMLSDLRESGAIEQDADIIMMLYREDYYDKEDPDKQGAAEIIIGKQRNGPTGVVKLRFESEIARFRDADPEPFVPPRPPSPGGGSFAPNPGGKPRNFANP